MTTDISQTAGPGTATIYQFPVGGRRGLAARPAVRPQLVGATMEPRVPSMSSSAWYHDEAIAETKRPREH